MLLIIQGLLQVLVQLEEYLIPADQICLDWNYIYLDPVSCYPSFCCLPAAEKKLEQGQGTSGRVASTTGSSGTDRGIGSL